jgi:GTPase
VYTDDESQIVFLDTPGIHKPLNKLDDFMEKSAFSALQEVDAVLFMVSATETRGAGDNFIINRLKSIDKPIYLLINKIDEVNPNKLLDIMDLYKKALDWKEVFPISALQGNNIDELMGSLKKMLPAGPQYYPADEVTDHPERFIVAELIREKILMLVRQEIPYSVAIEILSMKTKENGNVDIEANILVDRPGQKGILIGKQGSMLKKIGTLARKDIETLLGSKVYLKLWVKVHPGWRDESSVLKSLGYRKENY